MPTLYIIATPIGNLEDITLRALRMLKEADVILCEDTRVTKKLLQKYDIAKHTLSYHAQSGLAKIEKIIALLEEGKHLALVSDAGTPGISDPGSMLVSRIREHFNDKVTIEAIPGPSAVTTALSAAGVPASEFLFLGFLPHKKGRETLFREILDSKRTVVFYESPHRIMKTLARLAELLSPSRRVVIARELTKMHEEFVPGSGDEVLAHFQAHPETVRGEFVVVVS
jgi:16S rRNA (cytidine1402-2'-O)-methyltransferase